LHEQWPTVKETGNDDEAAFSAVYMKYQMQEE
jgi:hypothetical protein